MNRGPGNNSLWFSIAAAIALLTIGIVLLSDIKTGQGEKEIEKATKTLSSLLLACRSYAADWEGNYPPSLEALIPAYLDDEDFLYVENRQAEKRPFSYHPGYTDTSHSQSILIEYPFPLDGKRLVAFAGGHVSVIREK